MSYAEPDSWDEPGASPLDAALESTGSSGTLTLSPHRETGAATAAKIVASR